MNEIKLLDKASYNIQHILPAAIAESPNSGYPREADFVNVIIQIS